ncbi:hydroxymethylglutaryl-CoA lyase [Alcaligenaceae bacterium]|nr:hydroxymethylglutaryl-CoA lyase [Alcaligenaceae bacterium]
MSDLPRKVHIREEGPREGFQIEKGPIATHRKIELIDALSETGITHIQITSFVDGRRVPGMADAEAVVAGIRTRPGVHYEALWLNEKGLERAITAGRLHLEGNISMCASETFLRVNYNRSFESNISYAHQVLQSYLARGILVRRGHVSAAFGCNYQGDVPAAVVLDLVDRIRDIGSAHGVAITELLLADSMAWATPAQIKRVVGSIRERHPDLRIALHLHDTRGMGIANAYAGLEMGVDSFDASVAGLGGCPFARHQGAAGNVCTEDLVFMCHEMGIETGIDLDRLIECARQAEDIVGHPLPGSVKSGGGLAALRRQAH